MGKLAVIFPGQGAQSVGMGKDLYDSFPEARRLFDQADSVLGQKISETCFSGPEQKLKDTLYQQLSIFLVSAAAWDVLKAQTKVEPYVCAGLSLGEYTCLYAAEVLTFAEALSLVAKRASFMAQAAAKNPSCMLAVLGVSEQDLQKYDRDLFYIANLNCPGQVVISLKRDMLEETKKALASGGITRIIELGVSGGFHCPFMKEAEEKLGQVMDCLDFKDAKMPIVGNVDAQGHQDKDRIRRNLLNQLTLPVLWWKSVEGMRQSGVDSFYEVGPSRVLRGILRKIDKSLKVENFGVCGDFTKLTANN